MSRSGYLKCALMGGASAIAFSSAAMAEIFNIPGGDLESALDSYSAQTGVALIVSADEIRGIRTKGARGNLSDSVALADILGGTGFVVHRHSSGELGVARDDAPRKPPMRIAAAAAKPAAQMAPTVETVVVTAQHKSENIQSVPISITAMSQQQLTERQIAAGPDLLRDVPNMNFSKTNFSGYNIELRGIGTQAISVTTDPAVAVAFNDTPFIRNHFFEQEFYDLQDVEVLRGPQGTLYGRNATAGVVNLKSALPTDSYEAMLSADVGNYSNRRLEGMLNIPLDGDMLDLRIAGEWTKRDGYTTDTTLDTQVDGRDLWSGRMTLGWKPASNVQTYLIWEHFSEDDDRLRSGKQLCTTNPTPQTVDGVPTAVGNNVGVTVYEADYYLSQGCQAGSLYAPSAFGVPNGQSLAYASAIGILDPAITQNFDPYASTTQSTNLRDIQSAILPHYRAKNDTLEYNADWNISNVLTLTSQTGYNNDFLFSTEDYNRFNTAPGIFGIEPNVNAQAWQTNTLSPDPSGALVCQQPGNCFGVPTGGICAPSNSECVPMGVFCDPQVGCSNRLVGEDLSEERAWQLSQEFRLASNFSGPLNFSAGGNYLHYETVEDYFVFINTLTDYTATAIGNNNNVISEPWIPGVSDNSQCIPGGYAYVNPFAPHNPVKSGCGYIDPNPITSLDNEGHNYFLSENPYVLNSYALFGEAYYDIAPDLKLTAGARWTEDQKHFLDIPSELLLPGYGYPVTGIVNQKWDAPTGRVVLDWTPNLNFTDQTLVYGSYAHGYKAGGANPPGAILLTYAVGDTGDPIHPLTFKPEYIDAFELGTKNSLLDNALTLNGDVFYYNYTGYQISEIVDRTAINNNYNATVEGSEIEVNWEPIPALKFGVSGGFENATADKDDEGIDLMDRTAGNPNWIVVKPFITQASNCILPTYVVAAALFNPFYGVSDLCGAAYGSHLDPVTDLPYVPNPTATYPGFDPLSVDPNAPKGVNNGLGLPPNNGEGFDKQLGGNQLPNAPHFTTSFTAEYSMPVSDDWVGTLHGDFYWQSQSWARIFNDNPYDKLHGYSNVNLSLILTSANGWQVMGYVKNVFNVTAITGDFLNSDDSGLTTNVFLTDPRLYGVRVTKHLDQDDGFWGSDYNGYDLFTGLFSDTDKGRPPLWIELGGQLSLLDNGQGTFAPAIVADRPSIFLPSQPFEQTPLYSIDETGKISFEPDGSDWVFSAAVRIGRSVHKRDVHQQTDPQPNVIHVSTTGGRPIEITQLPKAARFADTSVRNSETHLIADFEAGKDVGLGMFGIADGSSVASLGVRFAQFTSKSNIALNSDPDWHRRYIYFTAPTIHARHDKFVIASPYHLKAASLRAARSFHGVGPSISWNASAPFAGAADAGNFSFDWGLNAAVLFGRQIARVHHHATAQYQNTNYDGGRYVVSHYSANPPARSRTVTVPNLGGFVGLSMKYNNAKVSFGYRADEFFGAIDGGIDTYKSYNRGFFGPFANISVGLGG